MPHQLASTTVPIWGFALGSTAIVVSRHAPTPRSQVKPVPADSGHCMCCVDIANILDCKPDQDVLVLVQIAILGPATFDDEWPADFLHDGQHKTGSSKRLGIDFEVAGWWARGLIFNKSNDGGDFDGAERLLPTTGDNGLQRCCEAKQKIAS
ncbi:hypothetical protein BD410DRAFT_590176 [Rickenella mellea]|uniref:Uncharacterized protein n=1 Tax=Rickenella mellea TaxID=50990 RepID=A0A4Y7PN76_9AGAM|nr:hypothetical protein BD410DRAFT_590176 [Rickenella mellea]